MIKLAHPGFLWLLLLFIPLIAWYVWREQKGHPGMRVSTSVAFEGMGVGWPVYLRHVMFVAKLLAIACLIIILCRPQKFDRQMTTEGEGTDIVLAIDISYSMLSKDLRPNRLEAAQEVAKNFVMKRESDNIGIVIFAGDGFTLMPMTTDNARVVNMLDNLSVNMLESDGTAIGDGIATAINRIKTGKAKSKSIILLTDGTNNSGIVAPITAAEIAQRQGIKIYTIGVGTRGMAPAPYAQGFNGEIIYKNTPVTIDEPSLQKIASMTGGKYFRATDNQVLNEVFGEIDKLEKTKLDVRNFSNTQDDYMPWALLLMGLVLLILLSEYTVLRRVP